MLVDPDLIVTLKLDNMSNKHDANVRKSTLVNFQIGLIASLLFTYVMFEMYTSVSVVEPPDREAITTNETIFTIDVFEIEKIPKKEVAVKIRKVKKPDWTKPEVGEKETILKKLKEALDLGSKSIKAPSAPPIDSIIDVGVEEKIVYPIDKVTVAPIYPGCEKYSSNINSMLVWE